jgi:RNA polymerase sigma factor (sigma-70 family)
MNQVLIGSLMPAVRGVVARPRDTPSLGASFNLEVEEARELFEVNLALIGRIVAFVCRQRHFSPDEAEEFESDVNLKLIDEQYRVIRAWQRRSSFSTYLSMVIGHCALDFRTHKWGKWHPSAEAKRMGPIAMELEQIVVRDGRSVEEAFPLLAAKDAGVTLDSLRQMVARFPRRNPKPYAMPVEDDVAVDPDDTEGRALTDERRRTAGQVAALARKALARCPEDIRLVLRLHFVEGMTVAQIARALQREQKLLYRRIERCVDEIRAELRDAGVPERDVTDLIGRDDVFLDFDLGKGGARPSKQSDERVVATEPEEIE